MKVIELEINQIITDNYQPRQLFDERDLEALKESIKEHGQLNPILVRDVAGKYYLQDGERRLRACERLGKKTILSRILLFDGEIQGYEIQYVSNFRRTNPTIEEMAPSVKRYKEAFFKQYPNSTDNDAVERLCKLTGFSPIYFRQVEALNDAPEDMQAHVYGGLIGGYAPSEINNATRDEDLRKGLRDAYVAIAERGKKIGALAPRTIKEDLLVVRDDMSPTEKTEWAKSLLIRKSGLDDKTSGDFQLYRGDIRLWQDKVDGWSMNGIQYNEYLQLINSLENLVRTVQSKASIHGLVKSNIGQKV